MLIGSPLVQCKKRNFFLRFCEKIHVDSVLFFGVVSLVCYGILILYSASGKSMSIVTHQCLNFVIAFIVMIVLSQIPPYKCRCFAPIIYFFTVFLLAVVLNFGVINKGAQRWLDIGWLHFQPSEITKIAVPLMLAWYLQDKILPPNFKTFLISLMIVVVPTIMIAKQPDLGTAIIVFSIGLFVIFLINLDWKAILGIFSVILPIIPIIWRFFMQPYQKSRILTFLGLIKDVHGGGYNILQSKISIGAGGFWGKGLLHGTQTQLQFLPERFTDFIFAVCCEEFGFLGSFFLIMLFVFIICRCFWIAYCARDTFSRLLSSSLVLTFFASFFVNVGMVIGNLPVVGVPLPLVSLGGSSLIVFMASFGIIMSIHTHKPLLQK